MNRTTTATLLLLIVSGIFSPNALAEEEKYKSRAGIRALPDKWYEQEFASPKVSYMVDTVTRQCYLIDRRWNAVISIECADLLRRSEWEPILDWIKKK